MTVPEIIEQNSGVVTRKLEKADETFNNENAKVLKREQRIVRRYESHVLKAAQALEDEKVIRKCQ